MEGKNPEMKKTKSLNRAGSDAREAVCPPPFAAVFPELPPILDHLSVRVRDLNGYSGAKTADFCREISDAPERNAIEVGLKFSF